LWPSNLLWLFVYWILTSLLFEQQSLFYWHCPVDIYRAPEVVHLVLRIGRIILHTHTHTHGTIMTCGRSSACSEQQSDQNSKDCDFLQRIVASLLKLTLNDGSGRPNCSNSRKLNFHCCTLHVICHYS